MRIVLFVKDNRVTPFPPAGILIRLIQSLQSVFDNKFQTHTHTRKQINWRKKEKGKGSARGFLSLPMLKAYL